MTNPGDAIRSLLPLLLLVASLAGAEDAVRTGSGISTEEESALNARLDKARELINQGQPARAIAEHIDPVLARYDEAYGSSQDAVFCASGTAEALLYTAAAAAAQDQDATGRGAIVLGPTWGDAYLLKGYALVELKDLGASSTALQSALRLSPQNPQYISELAFVTQQTGESEQALALFQSAGEAADLIEDEGRKRDEKGRACRGMGYALVELRRLDDAEARYHSCLELNAEDKLSQSELEYIRQVRARL